jgi:hypothetical protein
MNAVSGISWLLMAASLGLVGGCISNSDCDGDDDCAALNDTCQVGRCVDDDNDEQFACAPFDQMDGTDCTLAGGESGTCQSGSCMSGAGGTGGSGGTGGAGGTDGTCGEGCGSPSDFSGTWTGTYECTFREDQCGEPFGGEIALEVTQNGCSATYSDGDATFAGSVCGDVFEFEGGGPGYTESGILTLVTPNMAMKESTFVNTEGNCTGDCEDNLSR